MSAEAFDLGLRLRAAHTGTVAPRLHHSTIPAAPRTLAVRATATTNTVAVTCCAPGGAPRTAMGAAALDLLGCMGVTIDADSPVQVLTDTPATAHALARLAASAPRQGDRAAVAAHLAWTLDRADFPDARAGYVLADACRTRWVTGAAPSTEASATTWRAWLGIGDDLAALHDAHALLVAGVPLPLLGNLAESATYAWIAAQNRHSAGYDWRVTDTPARAALALFDRCSAAELWEAALMDDPVWRMRAVHTGHVAHGILTPTPRKTKNTRRRAVLDCDRLDVRLSAQTVCTGWHGGPEADTSRLGCTIESATVQAGRLHLDLSFPREATLTPGPFTIREAAPNQRGTFTRRRNYAQLYAARRSWLSTGMPPTTIRRDVPLDVLVAAADPEQD
ncbi:hypothetical protein [Luteococcus sp.]|uniref:hypothetical protein n=1 Tax=Luteococcus sp. TaxID=1969402 RepID=UPI003735C955